MADFVARGSRSMLLLVIAAGAGSVALGLWSFGLLGSTPPAKLTNNIVYMGAAAIMTVLGSIGTFISVLRLFGPHEELRVGTQGVYWSRWSNEPIPWSAITRVAVRQIQRHRYFVLHLRDPRAFRAHGIERMIGLLNRSTFGGDVWISMNLFDRGYHEALPAFETFSPTGVAFEIRGLKPDDGKN